MNWSASPLRKVRAWFRKEILDREMSEELRAHLERETAANLAAGMSPDEARMAALRSFGHIEGVKEACRDQRGAVGIESVFQDVRYGLRMLRKNPGFTAVTVLILALGIGTTTAMFSIVNDVVLRPLPYPDSGRLVSIWETHLPRATDVRVSPASFYEWKKQAAVFSDLAYAIYWPCNLMGPDGPSRRSGRGVSANYFSTYGVQPFLGRAFRPEEETPGRDHVVILNHKLWVSVFGSRPDIINQTVRINEELYTIVGVMPAAFLPETMTDPGLFRPAALDPTTRQESTAHFLDVLGRLKPGITLAAAGAAMDVIAGRLAAQHPDTNQGWGVKLTALIETKIAGVRSFLLLLLGAVGLLLLIACVNVANLLLGRASSRQKEIALRLALGASRGRIVRQLLCESVLLSALGGLLGGLLAYWSMDLLLSFGPMALPRSKEIAVDGSALSFTCALALLTGVGFGLAPALQATRTSLAEAMKTGGRSSSDHHGRERFRGMLVILEVSLALVLLTGAGLLMRSFVQLEHTPLGFDARGAYITKTLLLPAHYPTPERRLQLVDQAVARLSAVPGVKSVAFTSGAPVWGVPKAAWAVFDHPEISPEEMPPVSRYIITPDYFNALSIALRSGRRFDGRDTAGSPLVAIVSEGLARKYFPNGDAIGRRLRLLDDRPGWCEIVGIAADVREEGPAQVAPLQLYLPYSQHPSPVTNLLVRVQRGAPGLNAGLRTAMDALDPELPVPQMASTPDDAVGIEDFLAESISLQRFSLFLFAVFSGMALVLSALGIYGVVAYGVERRTSEIGVRMALGARPRDVLWLIFSHTGRMVGIGLAIGLAGALATTRLLGALLFEVGAYDPATFAAVALVLTAVAGLACWLPARRATKVDPLVALRHD